MTAHSTKRLSDDELLDRIREAAGRDFERFGISLTGVA